MQLKVHKVYASLKHSAFVKRHSHLLLHSQSQTIQSPGLEYCSQMHAALLLTYCSIHSTKQYRALGWSTALKCMLHYYSPTAPFTVPNNTEPWVGVLLSNACCLTTHLLLHSQYQTIQSPGLEYCSQMHAALLKTLKMDKHYNSLYMHI